jgi:hypothetical protein
MTTATAPRADADLPYPDTLARAESGFGDDGPRPSLRAETISSTVCEKSLPPLTAAAALLGPVTSTCGFSPSGSR